MLSFLSFKVCVSIDLFKGSHILFVIDTFLKLRHAEMIITLSEDILH